MQVDGNLLVDGGLLNNLPVDVMRARLGEMGRADLGFEDAEGFEVLQDRAAVQRLGNGPLRGRFQQMKMDAGTGARGVDGEGPPGRI